MSLIKKKTLYKITDQNINFCSYSFEEDDNNDRTIFQFIYTKGIIGDFNDWNQVEYKNLDEVNDFENDIRKEFPNQIITSNSVKISITVSCDFLLVQKIEITQITKWIEKAIEFACFTSGLGIISEIEIKTSYIDNYYCFYSDLNILYTTKLVATLQKLMIPWGLNFSDKDNSIKVNT